MIITIMIIFLIPCCSQLDGDHIYNWSSHDYDFHYSDHHPTLVEELVYCYSRLHSHDRCRSPHHNLPGQYDQYDDGDKYADEYDDDDDDDDDAGNHGHYRSPPYDLSADQFDDDGCSWMIVMMMIIR